MPQEYDPNTTPITVQADSVTGDINQSVTYQGDVTVVQGDKTLQADRAHYNASTGYARIEGNLQVQGPELTVTTNERIESNLKTNISEIYAPSFQVNGSGAVAPRILRLIPRITAPSSKIWPSPPARSAITRGTCRQVKSS